MITTTPTGATLVQEMSNAVWTFKHDLNRDVVVDVMINFQGSLQKVLPRNIVKVDANTIRIEFSQPRTGIVRAV